MSTTFGDFDICPMEWCYSLSAEIAPQLDALPPAARASIDNYLERMKEAASRGDTHEVNRLTSLVRSQIEFERRLCCG